MPTPKELKDKAEFILEESQTGRNVEQEGIDLARMVKEFVNSEHYLDLEEEIKKVENAKDGPRHELQVEKVEVQSVINTGQVDVPQSHPHAVSKHCNHKSEQLRKQCHKCNEFGRVREKYVVEAPYVRARLYWKGEGDDSDLIYSIESVRQELENSETNSGEGNA